MISTTEAQTQNQAHQSNAYDERVFNERIRQIFNSIDSTTVSSSNSNGTQMTSIVDKLFPEQSSVYQQRDERRSSTHDLTAAFDQLPIWRTTIPTTTTNNSSASAFCGGTTNESSTFANRRQSALHTSSRSLRNTYNHNQQHHYRPPPLTRPRFTASSIRIPSAATM